MDRSEKEKFPGIVPAEDESFWNDPRLTMPPPRLTMPPPRLTMPPPRLTMPPPRLTMPQTPTKVAVCKVHQQPCNLVDNVFVCAVLPVRSRCRDAPIFLDGPIRPRLFITAELSTLTDFLIQSYPLHKPLAQALESKGYRRQEHGFDIFQVPMSDYNMVLTDILPSCTSGFVLSLDTIPKQVLFSIKHFLTNISDSPESKRPAMWEKLHPFQRESVQFAINRHGRVLLADEMGLGKTLQSLAIVEYFRDDWPCLIVCPSSLVDNWKIMCRKWIPSSLTQSHQVKTITSKKVLLSLCRLPSILILSYGLTPTILPLIQQRWENRWRPGIIVCDESHYLKGVNSQRTSTLQSWFKVCKRAILISGTPALNRPSEIFSSIELLRPGLLGTKIEFARRYCQGYIDKRTGKIVDSGANHLTELHLVLSLSVMARHLKNDVNDQLPRKVRHLYRSQVSNMSEKDETSTDVSISDISPEMIQFYQESAAKKVGAACQLVSDLLDAPDSSPFIIFAHHAAMMDGLQVLLLKKMCKFIRIDGSIPGPRRQELVSRFLKCEVHVALLSLGSCSSGLNLETVTSTVVFAELTWSPAHLLQAEARVHRLGQSSPVCTYYYVLVKGTSDDIMWPAIERKIQVLSHAMDGVSGRRFHVSGSK